MSHAFVDEIRRLRARGWALVPVPLGRKRPVLKDWPQLRLTGAELANAFAAPSNVGVLLGDPSDGLVDLDLDSPEALLLADLFLPPTGAHFGRIGTPGAHRLYVVTDPVATTQFRDPAARPGEARSMLVELRSTGAQTLVPPSVHPSGEPVTWQEAGDPTPVTAKDLTRAVGRLAAAALLARHWPAAGSRHAAALALAGGLLRAGWDEAQTVHFMAAVARAAGDEETADRVHAVASTADALRTARPTTGWRTLATVLDTRAVDQAGGWLGIRSREGRADSYEFVTLGNADAQRAQGAAGAEQRARAIPVPPFPLEVFPPLVDRYLAQGAATVGAPVDLLAVPFLGYAAAAIGHRRRLALKRRWMRKATLWTGVVAASGSGKSPADAYARAALDRLQTAADERFQEQFRAHERELAQWKAAAAGTRGDEPLPPRYEHWFTTDPTVEALAPMLQANAGVAAAFDELVAWARGCNAYKRGGNDRQKYLEIWNGRPLKVDRRTQGVLYVPDPVLCIVGGIQPERLPELTREASVHDGLLPRFCWTYPDVASRGWDWTEHEADELDGIVALFRQLRSAPAQTLRPAPAARARWAMWYDATMEPRGMLPPLAREVASKLPAHLATLWLVLHSLWDPAGHKAEASLATLERAIALVAYFEAHARRVLIHFGTHAPHVDAGLTGRVAALLQREGRWLTKTELWDGLHRNAKAAEVDAALGALLAEGRVETRTEGRGPSTTTLWRWSPAQDAHEAGTMGDAGKDEAGLGSYEATNQRAQEVTDSFVSYESAALEAGATLPVSPSRRCWACGGSRFADEGVCLTCHPRPGQGAAP
jgi:hypothetical protein